MQTKKGDQSESRVTHTTRSSLEAKQLDDLLLTLDAASQSEGKVDAQAFMSGVLNKVNVQRANEERFAQNAKPWSLTWFTSRGRGLIPEAGRDEIEAAIAMLVSVPVTLTSIHTPTWLLAGAFLASMWAFSHHFRQTRRKSGH